MGIFNYIETLGSLYTGKGRGAEKNNFEKAFKELFPNKYTKVYEDIENLTRYTENNKPKGGVYDCLRCGMTHEYLIKNYDKVKKGRKIRFTIYGVDNEAQFAMNINTRDCGIEILEIEKDFFHLRIYNPRFILDLYSAFDNLKQKILTDKQVKSNFLKRAKEISLHLLYKDV